MGFVLIALATVILYIFSEGVFSWLLVTAVTLLYMKGLFSCLGAYRFLTVNTIDRWHAFLSPLQWKISAFGFGLVALLFAISANAGEGTWLLAGTFVYGGFARGCFVAANNSA